MTSASGDSQTIVIFLVLIPTLERWTRAYHFLLVTNHPHPLIMIRISSYAHRLVRRMVVFSALTTVRSSSSLLCRAFILRPPVVSTSFTKAMPQQQQRRFLATIGQPGSSSNNIRHVGMAEMQQIIRDYEEDGREDSKFCVIDVRGHDEVANTGKLAENVYTLPVQVIMQQKVFELDPDDFEDACGFAKPDSDETIVFTCAAGVRSVYACHFAAQAGYSKLINYTGGANEWFTYRNF